MFISLDFSIKFGGEIPVHQNALIETVSNGFSQIMRLIDVSEWILWLNTTPPHQVHLIFMRFLRNFTEENQGFSMNGKPCLNLKIFAAVG